MSLPQAIKTMLQGITGVTNANITYGTRNQFATLPAIAFTINSNETMTVGSSPLRKAEISVNAVAETAEAAQDLGDLVAAELVNATYDGIVFQAIVKKNNVLAESPSGYGDETLPFISTYTAEIYYKE